VRFDFPSLFIETGLESLAAGAAGTATNIATIRNVDRIAFLRKRSANNARPAKRWRVALILAKCDSHLVALWF
jgi:hypothetical protein